MHAYRLFKSRLPAANRTLVGVLYTKIFYSYAILDTKWHMLALLQLGRYCVTAMLTTLPYNSFKPYCANTKLYQILIYRHTDCLKIIKSNASNIQYALKQPTLIILQLYTLLTSNIPLFSTDVLLLDHRLLRYFLRRVL